MTDRETQACSCGAWEKVEEALEKIRGAFAGDDRCVGLTWRIDDKKNGGEFSILDVGKAHSIESSKYRRKNVAPCDLPVAILELRDKIDPPKPKEREWRPRSDIIYNPERDLVEFCMSQPDGYCRPPWRNLTIEAEQASEEA